MALSDVKFYMIPMSPQDMTPAILSDLRNIILPTELAAADMVVWQSAIDWLTNNNPVNAPVNSIPSDSSKPTKFWNTRSSNPGHVLQLAMDQNGNFVKYSVAPNNTGGSNTSPETAVASGTLTNPLQMMTLGQDTLNFFAEWGGYFVNDGIPTFEWKDYSAQDMASPNFGGSGWAQLPLGTASADTLSGNTWPSAYVPCFHPVSKKPCFFKKSDFIANVTKLAPGQATNSGGTVTYVATDAQVGQLARQLVQFSPNSSDSDLGHAINTIARATK